LIDMIFNEWTIRIWVHKRLWIRKGDWL
jgi:hypothetical protein